MIKKKINEISNTEIFKEMEDKSTDKKEDFKKYMAINQKNSSFIGFNVVFLATLIIITYIPFLFEKLNALSNHKNYLINNLNYHMFTIILDDIILRVLWMQIQSNNLQNDTIDKGFNNSFNYHLSYIEHQIYDYNAFYIQYYQYFTSKLLQKDMSFSQSSQKEIIYKIPDRTGKKSETLMSMKNLHIPILLHPIQEIGKIPIYYNNSDYYFNETMVINSGHSFEDYYYAASGYIGFLINFQTGYKYYNIETISQYNDKILNQETNKEKIITNILLIILSIFAGYNFFCWYIFYSQTTQLFARYLVSHTQLRFFNNYLMKKTILIYDYIDNNTNNFNIKKAISDIEFENEFEQVSAIKHIVSGQVDDYKFIKIRPLSVKYVQNQSLNYNNEEGNKKDESSKEILHSFLKSETKRKKTIHLKKQYSIQVNSKNNIHLENVGEKKKNNSIFQNVKIIDDNNMKNLENQTKLMSVKMKEKTVKNKSLKKLGLNSSARSNVSNSTFQSSINLLNTPNSKRVIFQHLNKTQSEQIGHKLLSKPLLYIGLFIFLNFLSITLLIVGLTHFKITSDSRKTFKKMTYTLNSLFNEMKYIKDLLMNFEMTVLLNEEFKYDYRGNEYSNICDEAKLNIETHEVFTETSICFPNEKSIVDGIIQGKSPKMLKRIIKFQQSIEGKNFCQSFVDHLDSIKDYFSVKDLRLTKRINKEEVFNQCRIIGGELNNEGLSIAITGMYTTLNSMYNDFKSNKNRSENFNFELLNDKNLLMFQIENFHVLSRLPLIYYVLANKDILSSYHSVIKGETIFLVFEVLLMLLGIVVYFYFVILYGREVSSVDFFNKCTLHMILFK